jgi:hypothetical protein
MSNTAETRVVLAALLAVAMLGGCQPAGPPSRVDVPPAPPAAGAQPAQYSYDHQVRVGGAAPQVQEALRNEYVVALARVGDTGLVETPFGDLDTRNVVVQTEAKVATGEGTQAQGASTVVQPAVPVKLQPEPQPAGYTMRARRQVISLLQESRCFTVVERESVNDVVRELQFEQSKWVAKDSAAVVGKLSGVRYIIQGGLEANLEADTDTSSPDKWVGTVGFPEGADAGNSAFVFRLRMYSVQTGVIVAAGDGYGQSDQEALRNAVTALTRAAIRHYNSGH